jgi:acyl-coenzyme A thioesterase 13
MKILLTAREVLQFYVSNPHLVGGFGEDVGRRLKAMDRYEDNPKLCSFLYKFESHQKNIQETIHGGALATMIDVITTIAMLRMTHMRTISISLNTEFLNIIKIGEEVEIDTEITKIGKNVVFSECRIFTDPLHKRKLSCKGQHIKSVLHEPWNFMPPH